MKSYYTVHSFMYEDLNLSGTDLTVFAFLYSFKNYNGSLSYLAKAVGVRSTTTIQSSLKRLIDLGLIRKDKPSNKYSTCRYTVLYAKRSKHSSKGEWNGNEKECTVVDADFPEDRIETSVEIGVKL